MVHTHIDLRGQAYLIEHRKFGIGVFAHDPKTEEDAAQEIVVRIKDAVKVARPFFDWLAEQAISHSKVNVINNSPVLFQRYEYFLAAYQNKAKEAVDRKDERIVEEGVSRTGKWTAISFPHLRLAQEAQWLALAAVEAFFSWTEQVFIHLAILTRGLAKAEAVASLAESNWSAKYKSAFDLADPETKQFFDKLIAIRTELRNYIAHGAFGKQGEAFTFHSGVGAVPVLLPHRTGSRKFRLGEGLAFDADAALEVIERFIHFVWSGARAPARLYIHETDLPLILTLAADGTYLKAMESTDSMADFVQYLTYRLDQAANMDW